LLAAFEALEMAVLGVLEAAISRRRALTLPVRATVDKCHHQGASPEDTPTSPLDFRLQPS